MTRSLQVAALVEATEAEGPHRRCALWLQGCSLRCAGCCNPEMFDPSAGRTMTVAEVLTTLARARSTLGIEGLTLLGGEPLEQMGAVTELAAGAKRIGLGILAFTGYRLERARRAPGFRALWDALDTLVDGPYVVTCPEARRRYVGSTNQRILHRTLRYADPALWRGSPRAVVEIDTDGRLTLTGYPVPVERLVRALEPW